MGIYRSLLRPLLFSLDAEKAHHLVFSILRLLFFIPGAEFLCRKCFYLKDDRLKRTLFGIEFPNPVGLAAGFDKDARLPGPLSALGFGFIEVGTVTPLPQPGNDKPRLFRLKADQALINRMGFNNDGVKAMCARLRKRKGRLIIGANIGKNKSTPVEDAASDYEKSFRELFALVDYFAVNVSSPNTPGLRSLQEKEPLLKILLRLQSINEELTGIRHNGGSNRKPILLKISPDLSDEQLDDIIEVVVTSKLDGIIATNTTISRDALISDSRTVEQCGPGGLSGRPLRNRSTEIIQYIAQRANGRFRIIGVGGIHSAGDALEKLNAGADLVQLYTGFIYEGPALIRKINRAILQVKKD